MNKLLIKDGDSGEKIFSVDEITTNIKNLLENNKTLQNVKVIGEISNFSHYNKKHMYFDLKDEQSIIRCVMFTQSNVKLDFKPEDGFQILATGRIEVYKKRGEYQIIVEKMQLAGKGVLYLKFMQLKEKLEKEGLFRQEFKKPIPKIPQTMGIVTSLEGAAVKDIIKTISKRFPHLRIIIYPSLVQGNEAKYSIERGVIALNQLDVDVIIIARGGGSFEDLWSFNEENVVRAIFKSKIPIITGIGHEIDFTLADFVADKRAHTPSAAAELAVPDAIEISNLLLNLRRRLNKDLIKIKDSYRQRIENIRAMPFFRKPLILIEKYQQDIDAEQTKIIRIFVYKNQFLKRELMVVRERLNALSPIAILNRGYTLTLKGDRIVKSIKDINDRDIISTIFIDGNINSKVNKI